MLLSLVTAVGNKPHWLKSTRKRQDLHCTVRYSIARWKYMLDLAGDKLQPGQA